MLRNSRIAHSWMSEGRRSRASAADRAARTAVRDRENPRAPAIASSIDWWKTRSDTLDRNRSVVAQSTSPAVRSGCWRHVRWATIDPIEKPASIACSTPRTSSRAATSSAQSWSENSSDEMPRPCQRWSRVTTRKRSDSGRIAGYQVSRPVVPSACRSTRAGESGRGPAVSVTYVDPRPGSSTISPAGMGAHGM